MRSSTGAHYLALDHVRALAAFMVFAWHFTHGYQGALIPYEYVPSFPFSLLEEGHAGVALFMTLSGYLFAKLLDGQTVDYRAFILNRALRLLPLLLFVVAIVGALHVWHGANVAAYLVRVSKGVLLPTLPNGGWSITAEFHFYLVLPLLLWMARRSKFLPLVVIAAALYVRTLLLLENTSVHRASYLTIIGRIDQFVLGIVIFQFRHHFARRHWIAALTLALFAAFYQTFNLQGGLHDHPFFPSINRIWLIMPTVEGLAYATLIAWYDTSFAPANAGLSRFIGKIGEYSYSIYLLHFFLVFEMALAVGVANWYVMLALSVPAFFLMVPVAYLSYRFIESPFLKLRRPYILQPQLAPA